MSPGLRGRVVPRAYYQITPYTLDTLGTLIKKNKDSVRAQAEKGVPSGVPRVPNQGDRVGVFAVESRLKEAFRVLRLLPAMAEGR